MERTPLVVLLLLCLSVGGQACSIDGDWSKSFYNPGETMRFSGDISPYSGFIKGYLTNKHNDTIAYFPLTQVYDDFDFYLEANASYINGTYHAYFFYVLEPNGTECYDRVVDDTILLTGNSGDAIHIALTLTQKLEDQQITLTGAPIAGPLGTIESTLTMNGPGLATLPATFKIDGQQLFTGEGIGNVDLHFSVCQQNQEIMDAHNQIASFLGSGFTQTVEYEKVIQQLQDEYGFATSQISELQRENANLTKTLDNQKKISSSKPDWLLAIFIFIPLGFFLHIIFVLFAQRSTEESYNIPVQYGGVGT